MKYEAVIGLEIHIQVKTKTKMFSRVSAEYFNAPPNTHIDPVSIGMPGALPVPNKLAVEKAVRLAIALSSTINEKIHFDRKNYFYPDLPKGYQISQYDKPIGHGGYLEVQVGDDARRIRITRLHLEEDTGKSIHSDDGETLVDYNKSGVPLIEIVTEPDFQSAEEVLAFAKRLRQLVRYTDTSDAEMQKGQMRFELNISMREAGTKELPDYKVEVKNIGSISVLEKVLSNELKRQEGLLNKGEKIPNQTRGVRDMTGKTVFQRSKETSDDYRYFPEPDIPPIVIEKTIINNFTESMPELPGERFHRYIGYGLEHEQAEIFVEDQYRGDYYDSVILALSKSDYEIQDEYRQIAKWINTDLAGILIKHNVTFTSCPVKSEDVVLLISKMQQRQITGTTVKYVMEKIVEESKSKEKLRNAEDILRDEKLIQISDSNEIENFVEQVIQENKNVIDDLEKNPNALKFLVGQVMRLSKGRVNPNTAESLLKEKLSIK
jgi:aspartyl-tRNA(Asn)/glutamyl-tRNA(Gln) amidotransferase subunit B